MGVQPAPWAAPCGWAAQLRAQLRVQLRVQFRVQFRAWCLCLVAKTRTAVGRPYLPEIQIEVSIDRQSLVVVPSSQIWGLLLWSMKNTTAWDFGHFHSDLRVRWY